MIDKKAAFLAGVSRRCKQANMDGADEEQIARLLFMAPEKAACVLGQLVCDRRDAFTKDAGLSLAKRATIDPPQTVPKDPNKLDFANTLNATRENNPNYVTPGAGIGAATQGQQPTSSTVETTGEAAAPVGAADTEITDASMTPEKTAPLDTGEPPAPIDIEKPMSGAEVEDAAQAPPPIALAGINQKSQRQEQVNDHRNAQRDKIREAFGEVVTPDMLSKGRDASWLERMQQRGSQEQDTNTVMRGIQKQWGLGRRPIRGGLRASDINPAGIADPDLRRFAEWQKERASELENRERNLGGGFRRGWSTAGSGFSGGGVRALRGRGAQPTGMSTGTAVDAATGAAPQKQPMTMGQANRARIPELEAQNKQWSISQDGKQVRTGNWGTPAPPAAALAEGGSAVTPETPETQTGTSTTTQAGTPAAVQPIKRTAEVGSTAQPQRPTDINAAMTSAQSEGMGSGFGVPEVAPVQPQGVSDARMQQSSGSPAYQAAMTPMPPPPQEAMSEDDTPLPIRMQRDMDLQYQGPPAGQRPGYEMMRR